METIEELFQQLEAMTDRLLCVVKATAESERYEDMDLLFADRGQLLMELRNQLERASKPDEYEHLYRSWRIREDELVAFVRASLDTLDKRIKGSQHAQTISRQYDSYMRQTPYGAFFDKKK